MADLQVLCPNTFKLLFLSTPVGPIGAGLGGGVELTIKNIAHALMNQGHEVSIIAPKGSKESNLSIIEIDGVLQCSAQAQQRDAPIELPKNSVLENMWDYARHVQGSHHIIVNFAYDWLPFYLTPWFVRPIAHLISMGSLSEAMDAVMAKVNDRFPGTLAVHTWAQASTFAFGQNCRNLSNGLDLSQYTFQPNPDNALAWVGRIAPEKGIEDAIAAAQQSNMPLRIFGAVTDQDYWQHIQAQYSNAPMQYEGFLSTEELQGRLGQCQGLLMTPKWIEAFGNVVIEALACGVPVIAYRRGGPAEIVQHSQTGWLVEPDDVSALVDAIAQISTLDRHACRQSAEEQYSLEAMGDRVIAWLTDVWIRSQSRSL